MDVFGGNRSPSEHDVNDTPHPNVPMKVDSLFVFPIKSCAAMRVNRWPVSRPFYCSTAHDAHTQIGTFLDHTIVHCLL
jgi:hypothetical protein